MTMSITVAAQRGNISVFQIPALKDNYIYIIHNALANSYIVVDPGEAPSVLSFLRSRNGRLSGILITHHHADHIAGVDELAKEYSCPVFAEPFPSVIECGSNKFLVEPIPGHTEDHLFFYLQEEGLLFSGDTLFSMGCGRLFEGTFLQMLESLRKIRQLPEDTLIFCTHEYTEQNTLFALSLEPHNRDLQNYLNKVREKQKDQKPTVPTLLALEKQLNPFLRWDDLSLKKTLSMVAATDLEIFTHVRTRKDQF